MRKIAGWSLSALRGPALLGAFLVAISLGAAPAAAQPAGSRTDAIESHDLETGTVDAKYAQALGEVCTGGSGVTVCPKLASVGDPNVYLKSVFGSVSKKETKLRFCVTAEGLPENVEVVQSTGKPKADRDLQAYVVKTYRYAPGTVDGAATRLCNVFAQFKF
jgi:hypothetical protein